MGITVNMALYHYIIWMVIGLAVTVGLLTIGVMLYAIFFENNNK